VKRRRRATDGRIRAAGVALIALAALAALAAGLPARAGDGRIEINQTCAVRTGCTSSDPPGFPVELLSSGSYVLTSNLEVTEPNATAILLTAPHVWIDLAGFTVQGPNACESPGPLCAPVGLGVGILSGPVPYTTLRNGTVRGFGSGGVVLRGHARVENVLVSENGSAGLRVNDGSLLQFERIYPLDAAYDKLEDAPEDVRTNRRYAGIGDFSVAGLVQRLKADFGDTPLDIVVHSLANGPEVKKPLLETSRHGYLTAVGVSAYSFVSLVSHFSPILRPKGAFLSLSYIASERVCPGYGGGMSSAKAALESDTRTLAFEVGRKYGHRVNALSPGPWGSRAASAIGIIEETMRYTAANAPLQEALNPEEVGAAAAFLLSPLGSGVTGTVMYVDKGYHTMGKATEERYAAP